MSHILSESVINHAIINEQLTIKLEEPPNNNRWELELPPHFQTIRSSYSPIKNSLIRQWIIIPTMHGEYTINCHCRRLCCGRPILKTVTFKLIVH